MFNIVGPIIHFKVEEQSKKLLVWRLLLTLLNGGQLPTQKKFTIGPTSLFQEFVRFSIIAQTQLQAAASFYL